MLDQAFLARGLKIYVEEGHLTAAKTMFDRMLGAQDEVFRSAAQKAITADADTATATWVFSVLNDARLRVPDKLALVGLSGLERRPARRLSGGEQQRLALARALARDPGLLLLDEPTASLDPAATKAIEDIVHSVAARGVKVVMSTHDLGQARRMNGDVALLHRGRLIEHAPVTEFFAMPKTEEAKRFIAGELLV